MTKTYTSDVVWGTCRFCGSVGIPDVDLCPECLVERYWVDDPFEPHRLIDLADPADFDDPDDLPPPNSW